MASHLTEEELWAANVASRLKLLQANCANESAADRQEHIAGELERALKEVAPSQRDSYLKVLGERFPAWQTVQASRPADSSGDALPEDPESLADRLIESAGSLSSEARATLAGKLHSAGFAVSGGSGASLQAPPELREKLGLKPGQEVDPQRLLKLGTGLTELVQTLDQLVWTLWRQLAPRSTYRRESEFGKLVGPYLSGDPEVSTQVVAQPLERSRKLIAAFLGSVGRAGSTYAKKHTSRFAPEVIEDFANMEKKWTESLEVACWRKYRDHYKEHASESAIENEIQEAIVKATENLIMGRMAG